MSDFLARLAARAVGQAAVAEPRLPSLFETGSGSEAQQDAFEVIDDEVTNRPPSVVQRDVSAASTPSASGDPAPPAAASTPVVRATGDVASQRSKPASSRQRQHATDRPDTRQTPTVAAGEAASDERHGGPPLDADPVPPTVLAVPAVSRATASPVASWPARESIRAATQAPEPPAVRVHIGRLEIRANLPEPAPARPLTSRRGDADKGVSLADYLRGTR
jgi:hypothetical protein